MNVSSNRIKSLHLNKYFYDKEFIFGNDKRRIKVAFADVTFSNYKLSQDELKAVQVIKTVTVGMVVMNSALMDYLQSCDVRDNEKYRDWVHGWRYMYKTLTSLIREFKTLRKETYYTGMKTNLKLVPELMSMDVDFSVDLMARFKDTLSELATIMLISRENMKLAYKQLNPVKPRNIYNNNKALNGVVKPLEELSPEVMSY